MKLFLCPNLFTDPQLLQARECLKILKGNHEVSLSAENSVRLLGNECLTLFRPEECDLIVSLGGDGAVLRAAQTAIAADKPMIGINSGRLGFLCAIPYSAVDSFDSLLSKSVLNHRELLECEYEGKANYALNDITIGKPSFGETIDLTIGVDGEIIGKVRGDGLILATPTGSTAYNRSAGGPLLDPEVSSILMTPICSQSSINRALVLSDRRVITVSEHNDAAYLFADGKKIGTLKGTTAIRKSEKSLRLYAPEKTMRHMVSLV